MTMPYAEGDPPLIPRPAEQAINSADPAVRDRAVRQAGEIVRAAHREVAAGRRDRRA